MNQSQPINVLRFFCANIITSSGSGFQWVENEKIISQIVRISEVCDQNGDRVFKNNKSCHIIVWGSKGLLAKNEKYGTLFIYFSWKSTPWKKGNIKKYGNRDQANGPRSKCTEQAMISLRGMVEWRSSNVYNYQCLILVLYFITQS